MCIQRLKNNKTIFEKQYIKGGTSQATITMCFSVEENIFIIKTSIKHKTLIF